MGRALRNSQRSTTFIWIFPACTCSWRLEAKNASAATLDVWTSLLVAHRQLTAQLDREMVPYDTIDVRRSDRTVLTTAVLSPDAGHGR